MLDYVNLYLEWDSRALWMVIVAILLMCVSTYYLITAFMFGLRNFAPGLANVGDPTIRQFVLYNYWPSSNPNHAFYFCSIL